MNPAQFQITLKLFLIRNKSLLVLRDRKSGLGDLPGGRLGEGEIFQPFTVSLAREVSEELGEDIEYRVSDEPAFLFPMKMWADGSEALGIAFIGFFDEGNIELSDEHDQMFWVDLDTWNPGGLFKDYMLDACHRFLRLYNRGMIPSPD